MAAPPTHAMVKVPKTDLIGENEHHPGMKKAVRQARRKNILLRTFPALIKVGALKKPVKWLKDVSQSKTYACGGCARVGVPCILHNGSSYQCLRCLLRNGAPCSHQTCKCGIVRGNHY